MDRYSSDLLSSMSIIADDEPEVHSVGLCTDTCCNDKARRTAQAEAETLAFVNRLEFHRRAAKRRGQTAERAVTTDIIPADVLRPIEPEKAKSEEQHTTVANENGMYMGKPTCWCRSCSCDSVRTIDYPKLCRECSRGQHSQAA